MSKTPLTDAELDKRMISYEDDVVLADFARRLETELMDAPHDSLCGTNRLRADQCNCWKRDALARVKGE